MSDSEQRERRLRGSRRAKFLIFIVGSIAVLGIGTTAWSFFKSQNHGTGSALVAQLHSPTNVTSIFPHTDVRTVHVTWSAPTGPDGVAPVGYFVQRYLNGTSSPACGSSDSTLIAPMSCDATNVASNTYTCLLYTSPSPR